MKEGDEGLKVKKTVAAPFSTTVEEGTRRRRRRRRREREREVAALTL